MKLCSGMDFHSSTTHVAIMDEISKRLIDRKLQNDLSGLGEPFGYRGIQRLVHGSGSILLAKILYMEPVAKLKNQAELYTKGLENR